jgi:hypothetical protein
MRLIRLFLALLTVATSGGADQEASEIKIIANPDVSASEISRDDLNRIFLITKTSLPGASHVEPVLEKDGAPNEIFLKDYIGRSNAALMTYYRSLMFTGKAPIPRTFGSDSEVAAYVAKTRGAIGYVSVTANTPNVKILKVK